MIITDPKQLQVVCSEVLPEEISDLRTKLEEELAASAALGHPGIGLAAPQIGIPKRMAIIRIPTETTLISFDLVNLKSEDIVGYNKIIFEGEGCLSFPGLFERTWRYSEVYIKNNGVAPFNFILTGLPAIVAQHEQDHLDGILFTEKMIKNWKK